MIIQRQIEQLTTHRASEWLDALKSDDEKVRTAFVAWLAESPRHVSEVLSLVALGKELKEANLRESFDIEALLRDVSPTVTDLRMRQTPPQAEKTRRVRKGAALLAACAAFVAIAVMFRNELLPAPGYTTLIGEQRSIELSDGSVVYLNAQSTLRVRFDSKAREVDLQRGEALFKVAHDTQRPFRVRTRDAVVRAVGTQFNVYARIEGTTVSVLEGKIQITANGPAIATGTNIVPTALKTGESAEIAHDGKIDRKEHADVSSAVAWRQRRVVFDNAPLEELVREFNRYNLSPQLRVEGITAGARHYSGDFDANDPESLATLLSRESDLSIERRGDDIIIKQR